MISCQDKKASPIAILGAMPEEIALLKKQIINLDSMSIRGYKYYQGQIGGNEIVLSLCGIGKVNAAISTSNIICNFEPSHVFMTGIAGSINEAYEPGDIIITSACIHHDFGLQTEYIDVWATTNPNTQRDNPLWLPSSATTANTAYKCLNRQILPTISIGNYLHQPRIFKGKIATGDQFIASETRKIALQSLGVDAVEMEGAAVAQTCLQLHTPFLMLRAISDKANGEAEFTYDELKPHVANLSAQCLFILLNDKEFLFNLQNSDEQ